MPDTVEHFSGNYSRCTKHIESDQDAIILSRRRMKMEAVSFRQKKKGRSDGVPISFGSYTREGWPMSVSMFSYSGSNVNRQNGQFCPAFHVFEKVQTMSGQLRVATGE